MDTESGDIVQQSCFPPISSGHEIILILGSFPGQRSLAQGRYYAHPRNAFWPIIGALLGFDPNEPYSTRVERLTKHRIALWDVLSSCRRKGSLDTSIVKDSMLINDFNQFFSVHRSIQHVMFNGRRAESEFRRHALSIESIREKNLELHGLPSTSPAMARLTLEQKIAKWRCITTILSESPSLK